MSSQNATTAVVDCGLPARVVTGHDNNNNNNRFNDKYVLAICLPGVEVTGLYDAVAISELLQAYRHVHRQVIVSNVAPALSLMVRSTHALPPPKDDTSSSSTSSLGIVFDGFPAKVKSVDSQSPYCNYISAQQAVHAVTVPGRSTLCLKRGGFTGHGVQTYLEETAHIVRRQLILQGPPGAYIETNKVEPTTFQNRPPPPNAPAGGQWGKVSSTWMQLLWKGLVCCGQCLGCCCFHTCIVCLAGLSSGGGGGGGAGSGGSFPKCPCEQDEEMDAYRAPNGILYSPTGQVMGDEKSRRFKA